jgi:putative spermidine/putrescine transport system ATP-binding protein
VNIALKLKIERVRKSYGDVHALRESSLDVPAGEFLTLLGPSGSGKTTLLMMLAGLVLPDGGKIWIDGRDATYAPVHRRGIGMMFQNYALFPHLTVAENVAFPLRMRKVAEAEISRRVKRILDIVRLPHAAERLPKELSGGQQQRIALARCAVYEPSIILMDEPLGALDKKLRDQMQLEIKRLHVELGTTILYVTHDQDEAMTMSDRICLMNDGAIEQLGTPEDLYFKPTSIFAADFLGGSNFLNARVKSITASGVELLTGRQEPLVAAEAFRDLRPETEVRVLVRPEHIEILADGETADNVMQGRVVRSLMVGAIRRHFIELAGGEQLCTVQLTSGPSLRLGAGDHVRLGWRRESAVLLPQGAAA